MIIPKQDNIFLPTKKVTLFLVLRTFNFCYNFDILSILELLNLIDPK